MTETPCGRPGDSGRPHGVAGGCATRYGLFFGGALGFQNGSAAIHSFGTTLMPGLTENRSVSADASYTCTRAAFRFVQSAPSAARYVGSAWTLAASSSSVSDLRPANR